MQLEEEAEVVFPLRRALSCDDAFFAWGDSSRSSHSSKVGVVAQQGIDEDVDASTSFTCSIKGCTKRFVALKEFEKHYRAAHQFQCNECSKIFLSARLLDIHISEMHDSYFRAMAERQPMYVCLAEGCPETFRNADARQRHLVCDHHYPKTYDFHHPFHSREKQRSKTKNQAKPAQRICAFYMTRKGCRNGELCPFAHITSESAGVFEESKQQQQPEPIEGHHQASMDIAEQIDDLTTALENTHIRVPKEISFGRKTGGRTRKLRS